MNRNWKQGFSLICGILLLLALAGCGEKTTNPDVPAPETASEQPVEKQEVETEAESETVSALGDLQVGPFPGALGTDPNTLFQTDGSMAFAEDVIYFSNRQTYL